MAWKFYDSNGNVLQLTGSHTLDSHTGTVDSAEIASGAIDLAHMSVNSINSDQYVDRSIDTVHIGLNQVTLAEMAGGTDGNLITYDTSGDPAYVVTGTATHVLTSNGADTVPTFQVASGGISAAQMMAYESPPGFVGDKSNNHPGVAKAWCRVAQNGSTVGSTSYPDSYNIASTTSNGTGDFGVVWDIDFSQTVYPVLSNTADAGAYNSSAGTFAVGSVQIYTVVTNTGTATNLSNSVVAYGDQ